MGENRTGNIILQWNVLEYSTEAKSYKDIPFKKEFFKNPQAEGKHLQEHSKQKDQNKML